MQTITHTDIILSYLNGLWETEEIDFGNDVITIEGLHNIVLRLIVYSKECIVYSYSGVEFIQLSEEDSLKVFHSLIEHAKTTNQKNWLKIWTL